jgi:hypothetical protein
MSAEAVRYHVRIAAVAMAIMLPCLAGCGEWWLGITDVTGKVIVDGKPASSGDLNKERPPESGRGSSGHWP